jgi:glucosamine--fructose-6-phosphate aminotransferase (isomerizing)
MAGLIRTMLKSLGSLRLYAGRDPRRLDGPCIVFFPVQDDVLHCGLAGFVTIKGFMTSGDNGIPERFSEYFSAISSNDLKSLLVGNISLQGYLNLPALKSFEKELYCLKQDTLLQHALACRDGISRLKELSDKMTSFIEGEDRLMEKKALDFPSGDLEAITSRLITLKDISWGLREDFLRNQDKIMGLAGDIGSCDAPYYCRYQKINSCLNALDRLEVRGRDSAGLQVAIQAKSGHMLSSLMDALRKKGFHEEFVKRSRPGDLLNGSIHISDDIILFTYKTALVTGELGENTRKLRHSIGTDDILKAALALDAESEMYLAHTRWASVGAINEINCHPVNSHTLNAPTNDVHGIPVPVKTYPFYGKGAWTINAVLNGDIDNYPLLRDSFETAAKVIDTNVTTDTKVIPLQIEHYLYEGHDLKEAFRKAVGDFEGSHAIAMESNLEPGKIFLALKGSGQTVYVGLLKNGYVFASEIYGLVEETPNFIKMDGESCRIAGNSHTQGQIFILRNDKGPGLAGIEALSYDGYPLELTDGNITQAQITTRDIDRGEHPHFLLKEILDAPGSIRKTLRGKYRIEKNKDVIFNLDEGVVAKRTRDALSKGRIRNIYVIGQGTAAVAASAVAEAVSVYLKAAPVSVYAKKASDLSGFFLDDDMSDTLVIAITQSGTTTDTNRAVTMARQRGAHLIAIVNRRQSDITSKVDGVFYTSDGRDIEMSVASTKAFYSQIVAGYVLALFMAQLLKTLPSERIARDLVSLEEAPLLMRQVIEKREVMRKSAWDVVRKKQYWAVVGSGINKVASDEIRIKLSELCYKTISSDVIEDKKHIDLSSEPLILVCAAGIPEIVLEDIVKDVAIFKAHAATVAVIADEGENRFDAISDSVMHVPRARFPLSVIFNTLAGHIWGYYAACSLDALSREFKSFRTNLAEVARDHEKNELTIYECIEDKELHRVVDEFSARFNSWRCCGELATLSVEVASDIALLLKYAKGKMPVDDFWVEFDGKRTSSSPIDMLDHTLRKAIDELSRPVDAIRHQAKTVTVGTSRKAETMRGPIFDVFEDLGFTLENIRAKDGINLKRLQSGLSRVNGYTLYEVNGLDENGKPTENSTLAIVTRHGVATKMGSRFDKPAPLMGTKNTIVRTGKVYAGTGKSDDASIIIVPVLGAHRIISHLLLFHVEFDERMNAVRKKEVMGVKINDLTNLINEYNIPWKDEYIEALPIKYLLGEDVEVIADKIKRSLED